MPRSRHIFLACCLSLLPLALLLACLRVAPAAFAGSPAVVACDTPSLITAISTAVNAGATQVISLTPGCTYTLTAVNNGADVNTNGLPLITHTVDLTIHGSGATIVRDSAAPRFRLLQVAAGASLTLDSLTLSGGYTPDGTPASSGNAGSGGAILNDGGAVTLTVGALRANRTGAGGSCCSSVTSGRGGQGGGLYNNGGVVAVLSSTIAANILGDGGSSGGGVGGSGGGLSSNGGTLSVIATTLNGNVAGNGNPSASLYVGGFGGGIAVESGALFMTNSTLTANATGIGSGITGMGAGIFVDSGAVTVTNSTVASNTVGSGGSAGAIAAVNSTALLKNDLFVGNTGGECGGSAPAPGSTNNLSDAACGSSFALATAAQIDLGPLQDHGGHTWTMALRFPSVAIDAGADAGCPPTDQRGLPRPVGPHCDIGAYEFQTALSPLFLPIIRR